MPDGAHGVPVAIFETQTPTQALVRSPPFLTQIEMEMAAARAKFAATAKFPLRENVVLAPEQLAAARAQLGAAAPVVRAASGALTPAQLAAARAAAGYGPRSGRAS